MRHINQIYLEGKSPILKADSLLIMTSAIECENISPGLKENKYFTVLVTV